VSRIAALDKYISDDIRRHGNRLSELEKKITNVYQEFTATEALDDDALFGNEDDEEEDNAFVMYAPCFSFYQTKSLHGDTRPGDNLLTILARIFWVYASLALLPSSAFPLYRYPNASSKARGTPKAQTLCTGYRSSLLSLLFIRLYCYSAKSAEPPPPYPPPEPFVPLAGEAVKDQIGLLRGYFEHRLAGLDSLPDDPQNPVQAKLGPLGQVIRPSSAAIAAAAGSKKKAKPKDGTAAATSAAATGVVAGPATGAVTAGTVAGVSVGVMSGVVTGVIQPTTPVLSSAGLLSPHGGSALVAPSATAMVATTISTGEPQPQPQTPKKKKAATGAGGAGTGTGGSSGGGTGKKRGRPPEGLPPVVVASA